MRKVPPLLLASLFLSLLLIPGPMSFKETMDYPAQKAGSDPKKVIYLPSIFLNSNYLNTLPVVYSLSPSSVMAGSTNALLLEVNGTNFTGTSVVRFHLQSVATRFISKVKLEATIPPILLQTAGEYAVCVINPGPDGGQSGSTSFSVLNPAPTLSSISPNTALVNGAGFTLTLNGINFLSTSTLKVNSQSLPVSFVSSTKLEAAISAELLQTTANHPIRVSNPGPGGGESNALSLSVVNGVPALTSINPSSMVMKSPDFTLSLNGDQFTTGSSVSFNNQSFSATYLSKTQIQAVIPAGMLTVAGSFPVKVVNPTPGGGPSPALTFTVRPDVAPQPEGSFGQRYEDLLPPDTTLKSYDPKRFALITGLVRSPAGTGIPNVSVTVHGQSAYGTAKTHADGRFSIPVEGGGLFTMVYRKEGLITAQRQVLVPWNEVAVAETLIMIPEDGKSIAVTFDGNPNTVLTHQSTLVADSRGSRSATLALSGDNQAYSLDSSGNVLQTLNTVTLRATEYPVLESMPAVLPPLSAYTYCIELSVDGAPRVRFQKPLVLWVDNFLEFDVGKNVPVGYYDRDKGLWIPEQNGRVVKLLDLNRDGIVDALDSNGDNQPDDLNANGSLSDEVQGLTNPQRYPPGATFWRTSIIHFSPIDLNWPYAPPPDAIMPNPLGEPTVDQQKKEEQDCQRQSASFVEERSRIFHEDIPIPGTSLTLHYAGNRAKGYLQPISIPASGAAVPASLKSILVQMDIAGRSFEQKLNPLPNQKAEFVWNGLDYLERPVRGSTIAYVRVGFVYDGVYYSAADAEWAFSVAGTDVTFIPMRREVISWKRSQLIVYRQDDQPGAIANGWTLSAHHYLNPIDPSALYKGDGTQVGNRTYLINTVAGNGTRGDSGDGGPALQAQFIKPAGLALDPAGNIYIADSLNYRIRKIDAKGIITTVAGNGIRGTGGDGGLAAAAQLTYPWSLTGDPFGNLYFIEDELHRIRKIDRNGMISTVAGTGIAGYSGDGGPAVNAQLNWPASLATDTSGNLYIADQANRRIRKIDTRGTISTIAGVGDPDCSGDNGPAIRAYLSSPRGITVDSSGNLYIADTGCSRIRKIDAGGVLTSVAGNGIGGYSGDGGPAKDAQIMPDWIAADPYGNLFIADNINTGKIRIRKVDSSGTIQTVAGNGNVGSTEDGVAATLANLENISALAVDPAGFLYFTSTTRYRARKVGLLFAFTDPSASGGLAFAEENGVGHTFTNGGLHQATLDLDTQRTLLSFDYTSDQKIAAVTDRFGNKTLVQRNSQGVPTAIVSPEGLTTTLTIDSNRSLSRITYPDGSFFNFTYSANGLLTLKTEPQGNQFTHLFDANGRLSEVTDEENGRWQYSQTAAANGDITTEVRSGEGNLTTYSDHTYSTGMYTSRITDPTGAQTTHTSSADGLSAHKSLSCGTELDIKYEVDSLFKYKYAKESSVAVPSGLKNTTLFQKTYLDTNGDKVPDQITEKVTINGQISTLTTDTLQSRKILTSPEGRTVTTSFHPTQLLPTVSKRTGLLDRTFGYDQKGRTTSITTGARQTSLAYDAKGNLSSSTDPEGRTTQYSHDEIGRMTRILHPDSSAVDFRYDKNGNMTVLTNPSAINHNLGYNKVNLNSAYQTPLSGNYQYLYNRDRQPLQLTFPSGKLVKYLYAQGRLSQTQFPDGNIDITYLCGSKVGSLIRGSETILYGYDGSLLTSETQSGTLGQVKTFTYNNNFQLSSLAYAGSTVNYSYDKDGLLTGAGGFTITRNLGNGLPEALSDGNLSQTRVYNGYGEMESQEIQINGQKRAAWQLTYDKTGRIISKTETLGGINSSYAYTYDAAGRLLTVTKNNVLIEEYRYRADGNRTSEMNSLRVISGKAFTYSQEDHLLTGGNTAYQYDADGFLSTKTQGGGVTSYIYSLSGDLRRMVQPAGKIIEYSYDPLGRRIAKKVNGAITEKYLWQGLTTLLGVYAADGTLRLRFLYADSRMPVAVTVSGSTYYLAYDQVGTLRSVIDTTGNSIKKIDYDSYGNIVTDSNPTFSLPFAFAGGLYDQDTGLLRFGFRDYDPEIGRWTAKDPIGLKSGDPNLYAYVLNNPINSTDPLGLWDPSTHWYLTAGAMASNNFTYTDVIIAAKANLAVDAFKNQSNNPAHYMPGYRSEAETIIGDLLEKAIKLEKAGCHTDAMNTLGQGLHTVQDKHAHYEPDVGWTIHLLSLGACDIGPLHPSNNKKSIIESKKYVDVFINRTK